ncbi:MAG: hypothetical protein M3R02_23330 [Chloroflexota bacterium]|nr:hypothetical protein [Chloroflexota bacterium]
MRLGEQLPTLADPAGLKGKTSFEINRADSARDKRGSALDEPAVQKGVIATIEMDERTEDSDIFMDVEARLRDGGSRARGEYHEALRRGEPKLTATQSQLLARLRAMEGGGHAYGLARELGIKEETVRSALASLERKGLVKQGGFEGSPLGPARHLYQVVSDERAGAAIAAERARRDHEIKRLSQRLAALISDR